MDEMTRRLQQLGRAVAEGLEESKDAPDLAAARSRFLAARAASRARSKKTVVAFVVAAAGIAALGLYWINRPPPVSFAVGSPPTPGIVGNWISAGDSSTQLRFSEGTALALAPGTRVRVTETNTRGAAVLIENGGVHAKVTHASKDTRWAFHAGPFEVRVTGTEFDALWDPATETFEVAMTEGSVFTTGPLLRDGREIVAGERLRISIRESKLEVRLAEQAGKMVVETNQAATNPVSEAQAPPAPSAVAAAPAPALVPTNSAASTAPSDSVPKSDASSEPDWRALAASGKHKDALAAAERAGFSQEIARVSAADLFTLADAARLAGRPARAREALLAARTRYGVRGRTAFLIGKIAADQQGSTGEAATWFETYLREEPGGQLAEQALGRLIEIRRRGDAAASRTLAERYLAQYPQGAYAALARSVLEP